MTCAKCGGTIQPHAGRGRPATYCSTACKRLIEFERRRLARELAGGQMPRAKGKRGRPCKDGSPNRAEFVGPKLPLAVRRAREWAALIDALNVATEAIDGLRAEIRGLQKADRAKNSLRYARQAIERTMVSGAELPPALIEAKRLHLQLRRLIGYGAKRNEDR